MELDLGINSKVDLYRRLLPALKCKVRELEKLHFGDIKNEDIWNYLLKSKWGNVTGLSLSEMVDDILNLDNDVFKEYILKEKNNSVDNTTSDDIELL